MAVELHGLANRVRFLYAAARRRTTARKLEGRLAEIWCTRGQIAPTDKGCGRANAGAPPLRSARPGHPVGAFASRARRRRRPPRAHRKALRTLAEAVADFGKSPVLLQERRFHAEAIGQRDDAASRANGMGPRTAWEYYALGRAMLRHGDLQPAAQLLDRAVALQPDSLWAQFYRGQCALLRNRFVEAVDAFGACVALAPVAVCYYNRSLAYAGLGARECARRNFECAASSIRP